MNGNLKVIYQEIKESFLYITEEIVDGDEVIKPVSIEIFNKYLIFVNMLLKSTHYKMVPFEVNVCRNSTIDISVVDDRMRLLINVCDDKISYYGHKERLPENNPSPFSLGTPVDVIEGECTSMFPEPDLITWINEKL